MTTQYNYLVSGNIFVLHYKLLKSILFLFLLSGLSSCTASSLNTSTTDLLTPPVTTTFTASSLAREESTSTKTPEPIKHAFTKACEDRTSMELDTSKTDGSLAYYYITPDANHRIIVTDISTLKSQNIDLYGQSAEVYSKQQAIIGLSMNTEETFKIVAQDQELAIPRPKGLYVLSYLDDGRLLLRDNEGLEKNKTLEGTTDSLYLLNLQSGEIKPSPVPLPNFLNLKNKNPNFIQYSPNFLYVMYPVNTDHGSANAILDIKNEKVVWEGWENGFPSYYGLVPYPPVWMPDSNAITIIDQSERKNFNFDFFNISIRGEITRLTNFSSILNNERYSLNMPYWSPNGRYLAFPIWFDEQVTGSVYIFDVSTSKILDTCILWKSVYPDFEIVWSPDSRYIALNPDKDAALQIVEVYSGQIYSWKEPARIHPKLLGWLTWEIP